MSAPKRSWPEFSKHTPSQHLFTGVTPNNPWSPTMKHFKNAARIGAIAAAEFFKLNGTNGS
jgi:hypothetical protein